MPGDLLVRLRAVPATCRVRVRRGSLSSLGTLTRAATRATRVALVTDSRVGPLFGRRALAALRRARIAATLVTVPAGERAKSPGQLLRLWRRLARLDLGRRDAVVALGGGVVGDLAGFAAGTWLRGVPWVCVPTTLLAQADSSVGGKTAVNLGAGKNLVGCFHQPAAVLVDGDTLTTLPRRHRRAGLAEVVKTAMAVDAPLFRWAEQNAERLARGEIATLAAAAARALRAKLRIVRRDPLERGGARTALNYGHTLGHAIEAACGYRGILHGEAVAVGMRAAAALSERLAGLPAEARARQDALLDALGLPRRMPAVSLAALLGHMAKDKKRRGGEVRWVLTPRVGHASVPRPIAPSLVRAITIQLGARA